MLELWKWQQVNNFKKTWQDCMWYIIHVAETESSRRKVAEFGPVGSALSDLADKFQKNLATLPTTSNMSVDSYNPNFAASLVMSAVTGGYFCYRYIIKCEETTYL